MTETHPEPQSLNLATPEGGLSLIEEYELSSPDAAQGIAGANLAVEVVALLARAMAQYEVSQKNLCDILNLSPGAVNQVVNGDGNVRVATIGKYFRALGFQPRLVLEPVEAGRSAMATRATCQAIQNDFMAMIYAPVSWSEPWAPLGFSGTLEFRSEVDELAPHEAPPDWIDVPVPFENRTQNPVLVEGQTG